MSVGRLEWQRHDPEDSRIWRKAFAAAFACEALVLFVVGWHEHWLAHPSHEGLDPSRFVEAQLFQVPKQVSHLVDTAHPTAPSHVKEKALSKVPGKGRVAKEDKSPEQNQTSSGPVSPPTHGPVAIYAPPPIIPTYLRDQDLHASVVIDFFVTAQGAATPRLAGSSGNEELDAIAIETAKKWRFAPAERDHHAIDAKARLRIVFEVQ